MKNKDFPQIKEEIHWIKKELEKIKELLSKLADLKELKLMEKTIKKT